MYIELNLNEEGSQLAQQAFADFEDMGMGYEAAKALANFAISVSRQGKAFQALDLFAKSRELFVRQQNHVWPSLIDLYAGLVLFQEGRDFEARRRCEAALQFFSGTPLASKTALCELVLARLDLRIGEASSARTGCLSALERLKQAEAPALHYQAYFVLGQIEEALGDRAAAIEAYRQAHARLENLRSHLNREELKIAFLKDKLAIYESLVWMCLGEESDPGAAETAFAYIEQAKSRSLADLIAFRAHALPAPPDIHSNLVEQVRELREELNWYYRQIDLESLREERRSTQRAEELRRRTHDCEEQLRKLMGGMKGVQNEFSNLQGGVTIDISTIREAIPEDALLLEYYSVRDIMCACLLDRCRLEIIPVTPKSRVRNLLRMLMFQLAKFRLGEDYVRTFSQTLLASCQAHLKDLYTELLAPVIDKLSVRHLVIVPHDLLHHVPFHALWDGEQYLMERFSISYAQSASVYYLSATKVTRPEERSLILGVADGSAPCIAQEAEDVASYLPDPRLYVGEEATAQRLQAEAPASRFVHIATHGFFRQSNPMFSSIRLADSRLSVLDLYHLSLSAELVTLSGCGTGLNVVEGGDELIGLARGLFYAGAQSVLLTLWDVNDRSAAEFMKKFYGRLQAEPGDRAEALRGAMQEMKELYPHPYHWAPFALMGKFRS
jgi:CHAT domain-containing protein